MQIRLQKIISEAGIASRRKAEELILQGKVQVNGNTIRELGYKADPEKQKIKVNGKDIILNKPRIYIALHKPVGIISSRKDDKDRKTVIDLIPIKDYIYPVGRLDSDSSGLILLTNDGEVSNALTHPRKEIPKTYLADIEGKISYENLNIFKNGIELEEGVTAPAKARVLFSDKNVTRIEIIIHEGKNRQIRRMFEKLGYKVVKLKRIKIGNIELDKLPSGEYRYLTMKEIEWIKKIEVKTQES